MSEYVFPLVRAIFVWTDEINVCRVFSGSCDGATECISTLGKFYCRKWLTLPGLQNFQDLTFDYPRVWFFFCFPERCECTSAVRVLLQELLGNRSRRDVWIWGRSRRVNHKGEPRQLEPLSERWFRVLERQSGIGESLFVPIVYIELESVPIVFFDIHYCIYIHMNIYIYFICITGLLHVCMYVCMYVWKQKSHMNFTCLFILVIMKWTWWLQ